jgi:hypothetical protein
MPNSKGHVVEIMVAEIELRAIGRRASYPAHYQ